MNRSIFTVLLLSCTSTRTPVESPPPTEDELVVDQGADGEDTSGFISAGITIMVILR